MRPPVHVVGTALRPGAILAEIGAGTLLRALVLALVLVTPYFLLTRRRVRAARAAAQLAGTHEGADEPMPDDPIALETVVATLSVLATHLAPGAAGRVEVPLGATVDGRVVAPEVRDAVLADALARSGLVEVATRTEAKGMLVLDVRRS